MKMHTMPRAFAGRRVEMEPADENVRHYFHFCVDNNLYRDMYWFTIISIQVRAVTFTDGLQECVPGKPTEFGNPS